MQIHLRYIYSREQANFIVCSFNFFFFTFNFKIYNSSARKSVCSRIYVENK